MVVIAFSLICGRGEACGLRPVRRIGRPTHSTAHEIVLHREQRSGGARRRADLGVDVLGVVLRCAAGDEQTLGDLGVAQPLGHERQDLDFALAEAGRTWPLTGRRLPGRPLRGLRPRHRRRGARGRPPRAALRPPRRPRRRRDVDGIASSPRNRRPPPGGERQQGCCRLGSSGGTRCHRAARDACRRRVATAASDGDEARIRSVK